jgi:hypothetical protein
VAPPVLRNVAGSAGGASSISIPATLASPVSNDYRVLVLHTGDTLNSGQPVTASTPIGWQLLHVTPRGKFYTRSWVFGQTWTNSTQSASIALNGNLSYSLTCLSLSNYTKPPWTALITNPPLFNSMRQGTALALSLAVQADCMRFDFWGNFYSTGATNVANTITVPTGQTGSTVWRASTDQGYVGRVTYETILTKQSTGTRTATGNMPYTSQVLSLAIGGWTTYTKSTITTISLASSGTAAKHVTRNTETTMGLASTSLGSGRAATGETTTELALDSWSRRVYLTSTVLSLQNSNAGTHDTPWANSVDNVGLVNVVDGVHVNNPVDTTTTLALTEKAVGRVGGGGAPTSLVDQYTAQYVPPSKPLRFMFQDIRRGVWLNWDVEIVEPEITWTLSGPTMIRGKVGPEDVEVIRGIDAWGTWLHVEESGQIRASGILQPLAIQGDDLMIEAVGVHGYAVGMQFESEFSAIQIDAAEAMRQLWGYLQMPPDARLGVTLAPTNTGRLLGEPARIELEIDSATGMVVYEELKLETEPPFTGLRLVVQDEVEDYAWTAFLMWGYELYVNTETGKLVVLVTPMDYAMATTGLPAVMQTFTNDDGTTEDVWFVPKYKYIPAKPYEIAWWNQIDVGREIENLAKQTPFDFAEVPRWADDRLEVDQHITIGFPRLGTKRFDLRFAEDENLFAAVLLRETPNFYASQVIVRGAGEGRAAIRGQYGGNHSGRVRRVASLTDQTITTRKRAEALAQEELYRRLAAYTISEITIDATHDNAPLGSYTLGDDILVQANLPYYGEVQLWHRILAITWVPDRDEVRLSLRRSEQFNYGRVLPN